MRKELVDTEQIEIYLSDQMSADHKSQFETRMLIDASLSEKVSAQKQVHKLIRFFSRSKQRSKLDSIHQQLLHEPSFANSLKNIFA